MGLIKKIMLFIVNLFNGCYNKVVLRYRRVRYAPDVRIYGRLRIYGTGLISIGGGTVINSSAGSNPIGGAEKTIFSLAHGGSLTIGEGVGISNTAIVSHCRIVIEDDVRIGGGTKIYDTNFHSLDVEERTGRRPEQVRTAPVHIKRGAFIGAHCMILKGVTIGENSIIGAGSVVTRDIPDHEIWGGNPARLIRRL